MIDVFSPLGDAPPAPVNWTGVPEPPLWKELTGGMSWPPTGAFAPAPPPACAYVPAWPCKPWPPPPPPLWPQGWPWPLPLPPPPGAALPTPPSAAPVQPAPPSPAKSFPWGWVALGVAGLGAALLLAGGGASVLADNSSTYAKRGDRRRMANPWGPEEQERYSAPLLSDKVPETLGPHGKKALKKLRSAFRAWYKKTWGRVPESADSSVYAVHGWRLRGEQYHETALFVVTFEGEAREFFYESDAAQRALKALGYYLEFGHSWSAGVHVVG